MRAEGSRSPITKGTRRGMRCEASAGLGRVVGSLWPQVRKAQRKGKKDAKRGDGETWGDKRVCRQTGSERDDEKSMGQSNAAACSSDQGGQ